MKRSDIRLIAFTVLLALAQAGCSGQGDGVAGDMPRGKGGSAKTAVAGQSKSSGVGLCALFATKEMEELLGAPLSSGEVGGPMGTVCQWGGSTETDAVYVQIQVIKDIRYWSKPTRAQGYQALSGIGQEAYVVPEDGGWKAGSLTDTVVLIGELHGGKADRERAVKLLRTLLERVK